MKAKLKKPAQKRKPLNPPKITAQGAALAAQKEVNRNLLKAKFKTEGAKARLIGEFPEADAADIAKASRPGDVLEFSHYEHGKKRTIIRNPPPKDQFFHTPSEGRAKNVMPKMSKIKYKRELWNGKTVLAFFRKDRIHATRNAKGWKIFVQNQPITPADQIELMLAYPDTEFLVQVNYNSKYLVFEDTKGEEQ